MRRACLFIAVVVSVGRSCFAADPGPSTRPAREVYLRLAGEVEANLQKEILDRWFPGAVDDRGGGFVENYGNDWKRTPGNDKSLVYQSRLTWMSAQAAHASPPRPSCTWP